MPGPVVENRTCKICGKPYRGYSNSKYCPPCGEAHQREQTQSWMGRYRRAKKQRERRGKRGADSVPRQRDSFAWGKKRELEWIRDLRPENLVLPVEIQRLEGRKLERAIEELANG